MVQIESARDVGRRRYAISENELHASKMTCASLTRSVAARAVEIGLAPASYDLVYRTLHGGALIDDRLADLIAGVLREATFVARNRKDGRR